MKKILLVQMKAGQKARITEITVSRALQNKLMGMGIYAGREITKLSQFALKGPVAIRVGRSVLALGHSMAGKITAEVVE